MKILLVNENVRSPNVVPSLGLALLAKIAKVNGHQAKVIDYQITPKAPPLKQYVEHLNPDVIGFRVVNENWELVSQRIDEIKYLVKKIIIGGPFPTLHYKELMNDKRINTIFVGEAEASFVSYLSMGNNKPIPWVLFDIKAKRQDSVLPRPDFKAFHNHQRIQHYPIQLSRGCPYSCSFCSTRLINGRHWRQFPIFPVILDILRAVKEFKNLKEIVLIDDNPTNDLYRFKDILLQYEQLYRNGKVPPLSLLNVRADTIDMVLAKQFSNCGVNHLIVGVETFSKNARSVLKKNIHNTDIIIARDNLNTFGIKMGGSFIVGLPGDDWNSINRTINLAIRFQLWGNLWGHLLPLKGTPVRKYVKVLTDHAETMVCPSKGRIISQTASETKALPSWWQIKLWLRASIKTNPDRVYGGKYHTLMMVFHSIRYAEIHIFVWQFIKQIRRNYERYLEKRSVSECKF